jgi:hypothetical protein
MAMKEQVGCTESEPDSIGGSNVQFAPQFVRGNSKTNRTAALLAFEGSEIEMEFLMLNAPRH